MKITFFILSIIIPLSGSSQQLELDKYGVSVQTTLNEVDREYADSLFDITGLKIILISLLPDCRDIGNCHNESIINDDYNWNTPVSDSTFGTLYFKRVNYQYVDSSSIIEADSSDYVFFLNELLKGPRELDEGEMIDICYNPRHAVLFLDNRNKIVAIQEICFECGHTKVAILTSEIRHNSSSSFLNMFKKYKLIE